MLKELQIYFSNIVIQKFLIAVGIFYVLDFITGITKGWKTKSFSSNKLRNGVDKLIKYIVAIIIGVVADFVFNHNCWCIIMCTCLCGVELTSLKENYQEGNLKELIEKIGGVFKNSTPDENTQIELEDFTDDI